MPDVRHESGLGVITRSDWHPPPFDPLRAGAALDAPAVAMIWDALRHVPVATMPPIERLATAFVLLRRHASTLDAPAGIHAVFEDLGVRVSPEFAEQGVLAQCLVQTLADSARGLPVPGRQWEYALHALGVLWEAAFVAPSGIGHYLSRTLAGRVPHDWGFQPVMPAPDAPLAATLAHGIDVLHAAIALHHLPAVHWPVDESSRPTWMQPVAAINSGRGEYRPRPLTVHARTWPRSGGAVQRISAWLGYPDLDRAVAWIHGTVLTGHTGAVEDFLDLITAPLAPSVPPEDRETPSGEVRRQVRSVFANPDVVTLYARVRRLLDRSEHRVDRMLVIEHMAVDPDWRGRSLGLRLVQQLLMETGEVEIVLGRPRLVTSPAVQWAPALSIQAAEAVACLRQCHAWGECGGEFLINGVMGIALPQIQMARMNGLWERRPNL